MIILCNIIWYYSRDTVYSVHLQCIRTSAERVWPEAYVLHILASRRELPAFCVCTEARIIFWYAPQKRTSQFDTHLNFLIRTSPNCINVPQKVNLKKMHPAAFDFSCTYTNGISLRIIMKDYIITQTLINETALNLPH